MKKQNIQIIDELDIWLLRSRAYSNILSAWDVGNVDITQEDLGFFGNELFDITMGFQHIRDILNKELA
ncbi:hypothetical protein [Sulfurimonas sp.]|uniref:hypothetical protein n=1 Tax=Sulfurimonas sp. TaxID=2022749 RepID=UPI002B48D7C8|nr:hypothetical protein [Sulfurimonas sp.]